MAKGIHDRLWDGIILLPAGDHALMLELAQKLSSPNGRQFRLGLIELLHVGKLRWEDVEEEPRR
jgi:hypothetical protein